MYTVKIDLESQINIVKQKIIELQQLKTEIYFPYNHTKEIKQLQNKLFQLQNKLKQINDFISNKVNNKVKLNI